MSLAVQEVQLLGITRTDIQDIFRQTLKEFKTQSKLIYLDVNYLYTFTPSDYRYIQTFTNLIRVSPTHVRQWHEYLERWHAGESVSLYGKQIKPIQIERSLDRVVNEFMERIAQAMAGQGDFAPMKFHSIGDGATAGSTPLPGDTALVNEVDRIDVTQDPGGGAMTVDGSTFFCIGNHATSSPSLTATETGIFDREKPAVGDADTATGVDDRMGDHSIFPTSVSHLSGQNAIGATTVIYQCSS